jgi:membrane associated rhomboid family serine protease
MIPIRDANPTERFPLLTLALITINTIVFVMHWEKGSEAFQEAIQELGLIPSIWVASNFPLEPVITYVYAWELDPPAWQHVVFLDFFGQRRG